VVNEFLIVHGANEYATDRGKERRVDFVTVEMGARVRKRMEINTVVG
jgi:hypothetical protein